MKKFLIQVIMLLVVIGGSLFLFKTGPTFYGLPFAPQEALVKELEINGAKLQVEVADTEEKRRKGLSDRQELGADKGMLFIFPKPSKYSFWMKGLTFPLDFIWIKGDKVVDVLPNVQPPVVGQADSSLPIYQPKEPIDRVLEVSAGTIQKLNIKAGDTVKIQ